MYEREGSRMTKASGLSNGGDEASFDTMEKEGKQA